MTISFKIILTCIKYIRCICQICIIIEISLKLSHGAERFWRFPSEGYSRKLDGTDFYALNRTYVEVKSAL